MASERRRFFRPSLLPVRHDLLGNKHADSLKHEATIAKRVAQLRALGGMLLLAMAVATFGSLYMLVSLASDNHRGVERIVDCTTPGNKCYNDQRNPNNNGAVDYIKEVTILAASCAKIPANVSVDQVRACVENELAKDK